MPVSTAEIKQSPGPVIDFTQHNRKPFQHFPAIGDRLRNGLTVVDSLVVDSLKERIRGQMCSVIKSTLAAGSERICVVRRNFEQIKAISAIALIVTDREILGADAGYDSMTPRVTHRTLPVYRLLHSNAWPENRILHGSSFSNDSIIYPAAISGGTFKGGE